ncbi:MAG: DNA topoisomerase VI subunit B [Candidatus Methanoperedens nitroreducens]|uniref:Type 2 DNA topoisomerase 6 subunit B n=1 Tax=Candidatus Methanoperedens nitratireducens TaxID=1392998 RepID=A0A0P8A7R6_9EURY|nr:DNA topoisomerase VI subunit B [Candidatus Methanoperedens sp. BLZ2]KAB2948283.1 MAG: DNA topoisomerase VI subunit B [Candidatus Methanoperedens sp.]KPQ44183.1 MAG: DNA topoisomerase VI subunit B [Candidatus Methanoperedens sp. BLZ1]MBZ0174833.1 DNA topoisomerase VI subunit B [Candidatus Methanoperedens nitroreducens]MCX9076987.1 DNA topoisomerase VI subunit B [Candidatus Methanoperedens sp.]
MVIAEELAKKQKAISIAEFFEKNRQILGFDSGTRSLLTSVKEAVDNSLDACEESGILPDIFIKLENTSRTNLTLIVEDNGPGIVKEQIPRVFAKLLYGSRFHAVKQSRGQQGIGISATVLYSQLTSGRPVKIVSKIDRDAPAHYFELLINTHTNEPEILVDKIVDWDRMRGTRLELEMEASYVKGRRQSVYEYLKDTAIVNPHARVTLIEPDNNQVIFERATDKLPLQAKEILPHPHGIELGTLMKMLRYCETDRLDSFLRSSFSRMGPKTADEICMKASLGPETDPKAIALDEAKRLHGAFKIVKILAPSTDCLSPITEELIRKGVGKEHIVDFIETTTRSASVHNGHPFQVEAGIAYGGNLPKEEKVEILRFANRVPLLYQQGACAITHAIENLNWRSYSLNQPGGSLPIGPAIILVHVASTHIPFTSESKEAIADVPEIISEVELALKDVARRLKNYLSRQDNLEKRREKEEIIYSILPRIAKKVGEILERPTPDITPIIAKIMRNVFCQRVVKQNGKGCEVEIHFKNHGDSVHHFNLHETLPYSIQSPSPEPKKIPMGKQIDYVWKVSLKPGEQKAIIYRLDIALEEAANLPQLVVEGIESELVTGAKAVNV